MSSSSLMTERIKGASVDATLELFAAVRDMLTGGAEPDERMQKLAALAGVREFPSRVKCASLAWHALNSALTDRTASISTE